MSGERLRESQGRVFNFRCDEIGEPYDRLQARDGLSFAQEFKCALRRSIQRGHYYAAREGTYVRQIGRAKLATAQRLLRRHHVYEMRKEGKSIEEIAKQIGRTKQLVYLLFRSEHRSRMWRWSRGGRDGVVRGLPIIQDELIQL